MLNSSTWQTGFVIFQFAPVWKSCTAALARDSGWRGTPNGTGSNFLMTCEGYAVTAVP